MAKKKDQLNSKIVRTEDCSICDHALLDTTVNKILDVHRCSKCGFYAESHHYNPEDKGKKSSNNRPKMTINGQRYFIDLRAGKLINVKNPADQIELPI